jgi:hypothetical protein
MSRWRPTWVQVVPLADHSAVAREPLDLNLRWNVVVFVGTETLNGWSSW